MAGESSRLKKVGIELGASAFGTAAASFTHGLLVTSFNPNPAIAVAPLNRVQGKLQAQAVTRPGIDHSLSLNFPLDVGDNASGNIGHFLQSLFGTDTKTGSNPYVHTFSRNDTSEPTWFNLYSDKDVDAKQYRGFRANSLKLTLKGGDGQIAVDVSGDYQQESELAGAQTLVFSGSPILTPQDVTVFTIGGSTVTNFDSLTITVIRDNQKFRAIGNSRYISNLYSKDFRIEIAAEGINFAAETERDKFMANTSTAVVITLTDSASNYLTINSPASYYTSFEGPDINEGEIMRVKCALVGTGDSCTAVLQNARSAAYSA